MILIPSIEQGLQPRDNVGRNAFGCAFFEYGPARPDIKGAGVVARDDALGIATAAHQRDCKARKSRPGAALRYRTDQRKTALIERPGRNNKYESRAALFGSFRGVEIDVPDLTPVRRAHQMISRPTGLDDTQARSSRDIFFEKSHFASSSARVYRGLEIGVSVTLSRSTSTLTRDPARKFSRSSEGLGRATTTEPPTARSIALDMVWFSMDEVTHKYNIALNWRGMGIYTSARAPLRTRCTGESLHCRRNGAVSGRACAYKVIE